MRRSGFAQRWRLVPVLLLLALAACREPAREIAAPAGGEPARAAAATPAPGETLFLALGGETYTLELALDPRTRQRGLGGRPGVAPRGGMLFVFPSPRPLAMVMRDCPEPIDVAFLDAQGVVVALHAMRAEPPRQPGEGALAYERRLPEYPSGVPAQFAIELAGGTLSRLGIEAGARIPLATAPLVARAR
jgi:uncharacterized membrane protein (UPF0127 family)